MELQGEKLAGEGGGEGGGGEGVVGDDGEAGETAQEVAHGEAAQEGRAVIVETTALAEYHEGETVAETACHQDDVHHLPSHLQLTEY